MHERRRGKVRVAVLFGGQSSEHDVSLRSAETVMGALDPDRYEVVPVGITREGHWLTGGDPFAALTATSPSACPGRWLDKRAGPQRVRRPAESVVPALFTGGIDVVFPVLHGPMGEDGTVQGLLELTGVPYVGAGVLGSALSMDKAMAKTILAQEGLPQAPWRLITRKEWERDPDAARNGRVRSSAGPVSSSRRTWARAWAWSRRTTRASSQAAMRDACRFDRRILIEKAIDARELEISVLGNDEPIASIVGEVVPQRVLRLQRQVCRRQLGVAGSGSDRPQHDGRDSGDGDRRVSRPRSGRHGADRFLHGPQHRPDLHQRGEYDPRVHRNQHVPASLAGVACHWTSWWTV